MVMVVYKPSFADAEIFKDITKYLVRRNFPYNVAQVEDTFTQILRDKVAG